MTGTQSTAPQSAKELEELLQRNRKVTRALMVENSLLKGALLQYLYALAPNGRLTVYNPNGITLHIMDSIASINEGGKWRNTFQPQAGILFYDMQISKEGAITVIRRGREKLYSGTLIGEIPEETIQKLNGIAGLMRLMNIAISPIAMTPHQTPDGEEHLAISQGRIITPTAFRNIARYLTPYIEPDSQLFGLNMQKDNTPYFSLEGKITKITRN